MAAFTDALVQQDHEGIFDLVIDPDSGDLALETGMETAILASLFTDRRAASDEVPAPLERRGWIGNRYHLPERPEDNWGSGWWLYSQHRLNGDFMTGMYFETVQALEWFVDDGLVLGVDAGFEDVPEDRTVKISVRFDLPGGGQMRRSWTLWKNTTDGQLARI